MTALIIDATTDRLLNIVDAIIEEKGFATIGDLAAAANVSAGYASGFLAGRVHARKKGLPADFDFAGDILARYGMSRVTKGRSVVIVAIAD